MNIETVGRMKRQKTIADMGPGETCYTVPWAAEFDDDGNVISLNPKMSAEDSPGGLGQTTHMAVTLTRDGRYIVDVTRCDWYAFR